MEMRFIGAALRAQDGSQELEIEEIGELIKLNNFGRSNLKGMERDRCPGKQDLMLLVSCSMSC